MTELKYSCLLYKEILLGVDLMRSITLFLMAVALLIPNPAFAKPSRTCLKEATGEIRVRRKCPASKGFVELNAELLQGLGASQIGPQGPQGPTGPQGPAGQNGSSSVLCFAKVDSSGTLLNFGGTGTTSVEVSSAGGGYDITCNGNYSGGFTTYNEVTAVGSQENSHTSLGVTVDEADSDHILVHIFCRSITSGLGTPCYNSVIVMGPPQ